MFRINILIVILALFGANAYGATPLINCSGSSYLQSTASNQTFGCGTPSGGVTITSPNSTLTVGGTSSSPTLDFNLAKSNAWTVPQSITTSSNYTFPFTVNSSATYPTQVSGMNILLSSGQIGDIFATDSGGNHIEIDAVSGNYSAINAVGTSFVYEPGSFVNCSPNAQIDVMDSNCNSSVRFSATTNAANYLSLAGGTTGNAATITATGSDTNVSLNLLTKGTGVTKFVSDVQFAGNAPAVTSCGSGTLTTGSKDHKGSVTGITAATACTITFSQALATAPACTFSDSAGTAVGISSISTAAVTTTMTALTGSLYYICF